MKQNTTYKQTELGLIPEDWEVKKLGECSSISGDYGINAPAVKFSEDLPTYLRITDIDDDGNYSKENKVSVKDDNSESFILDDEDIVFARTGATVGKTYLHNKKENGDLVFAGFLIRFRTNFDILLPYYLKLYTNTDKYWNWVSVFSMRSGQPGINSKEYSNLKIPLPPLAEQKKIADCLSTWDSAIEKQNALINALTDRKKALMQQLLTGKKRLPGFSDEWKEVKLGEISIKKSSTLQANSLEENNGEFKVYGASGIVANIDFYNESEEYIGIVKDGSGVGNLMLCDAKSSVLGTLDIIKNNKKSNLFFIYLILSKIHFEKYKVGGAIPHIYYRDYSREKINIPSLSEQTAIAEILATADRELQLQKEKLAQLQTQKKGLMQVLLTGKKRLIN